ncbi:MAG: lytic transglycosylase domain-containing protein [Solidesulfovibrio sp.]
MPRHLLCPCLVGGFLLLLPLCVHAYTLYGYEDEYGIVQLSEDPRDSRYVLIYEGPTDPKLGFAAIKKRIRDKGAVAQNRNDGWIREATRAYYLMGVSPLGPSGFPPVIESGPLIDLVRDKSRASGLPPELVYAVIEQESRFTNGAVSPKGAAGLMQLMPETQATFGVANPFDPERNVSTGTKFLKAMLVRFGDMRLALAAYNAGPETVARSGGIPNIPETVHYVQRIMTRYAMLQESHPGLAPKKGAIKASGKGKGTRK